WVDHRHSLAGPDAAGREILGSTSDLIAQLAVRQREAGRSCDSHMLVVTSVQDVEQGWHRCSSSSPGMSCSDVGAKFLLAQTSKSNRTSLPCLSNPVEMSELSGSPDHLMIQGVAGICANG